MTTDGESHISRTSPNRLGKGIAVVLIVMAVGAGINIAFSDMWNKYPPSNQLKPMKEKPGEKVVATGVTREMTLTFTESSDLRTLGFNAPAGDPNANPDVTVNVGDTVIITAVNGGKMPHAFGVVSDPEDPNSVVFKSGIKSASDPILKGTRGDVTFTPNKEGEYYYICTVPGHALQGMQGKFIVKAAPAGEAAPVAPTGMKHTFDLHFTETADLRILGFNAPKGEANSNPDFRVKAGDEVTFNVIHDGKMPHAFGVVSDAEDPNSVVFSSAIGSANDPMLKGMTKQVTFIAMKPGVYYYICTVPGHAAQGMQGKFIVE